MKIDLIDESVDILRGNGQAKDYIGSVRVPMKDLLVSSTASEEIADCFPVRDENGQETGRMEVKVACRDYNALSGMGEFDEGRGGDTFIISKFAEREIIGKIADKFAGSLMESIDMIFDMLIEPGSFDTSRISK